jgi:hypothetical protein
MNAQRILEKARAGDVMIQVFTLMLAGNEPARLEAAEIIRKLDAEARRDLRAALQDLDELLDDVTLAELRERRPWRL